MCIYRLREKILDRMSTIIFLRNSLIPLALFSTSFLMTDCGMNGGSINQGTPTGTVVSQGSLSGAACVSGTATAAGTVVLYSQGSGNYEINFSGLSYTGGGCTALSVYVLANSYVNCGSLTNNTAQSLNVTCGNLPSQPSQVVLHCNGQAGPSAFDCAVANLTPT